jgi:hypothetical protein
MNFKSYYKVLFIKKSNPILIITKKFRTHSVILVEDKNKTKNIYCIYNYIKFII